MSELKRSPHYGRLWLDSQWKELQNIVNQGLETAAKNNIYVGTRSQFEAACVQKYIAKWGSQLPEIPTTYQGAYQTNFDQDGFQLYTAQVSEQDLNKVYATASKLVANKRYSISTVDDPTTSGVSEDNYMWNLPPHLWSLPYRPTQAYPNFAKSPFGNSYDKSGLRRGRIRWRWTNPVQKTIDSNGNVLKSTLPQNRMYGFQFIWNPEQFSTTTAINYSSTATAADQATAAPGWYPGAQNIDITVRLDRTNDFACFRGRDISAVSLDELKRWYPERMPLEDATSITYTQKLNDLMAMGTMADIDYLYRTVNDISTMKNQLGSRPTADAGYLSFNPVQFTLGPLGYVGFLTGISVNHIGFTEDYIPIRSDVSISARIMTNSTNIAGSSDVKTATGLGPKRDATGAGVRGSTVD